MENTHACVLKAGGMRKEQEQTYLTILFKRLFHKLPSHMKYKFLSLNIKTYFALVFSSCLTWLPLLGAKFLIQLFLHFGIYLSSLMGA